MTTLKKERPTRYWAGGFLFNPKNRSVFLHKRDDKTKINPNKWAFFGGLNEGSESPEACYIRELTEETGLTVSADNVHFLTEYMNEELHTYRIVFYSISQAERSKFVLGEGAGFDWVSLDELSRFDLTEKTKLDLAEFVARQGV
ncbi:MAG: NUDIX domain-containing protein [Minisyncoccota bacterium]